MSALLAFLLSAQAKAPPLAEAFVARDREYAAMEFSPDGAFLAAGASRAVRVLARTEDGAFKDARTLALYGRVDEVLFDSGGRHLVTRSRDQDALVWEAGSWAPVKFALEEERPLDAPDRERWMVLRGRKQGLRFWRMDGLLGKRRWIGEIDIRHCDGVRLDRLSAAAWAGRDELLLGDQDGHLFKAPARVYLPSDVQERAPRTATNANVFRAHAGEITALLPSADGRLLASAGLDGKVRLWEAGTLPSGARPRGAKGPEPLWEISGQAAALSADGGMIAVADAEGVGVYHARTGTAISWNPTPGRAVRLAFSAKGGLAAIVCRCADCAPGERVRSIAAKKRLIDHGGALVIWK